MDRVLEEVNSTLNAYYEMNRQVGNEKQTCLKDIGIIVGKKWNNIANDWIPKYSEECPNGKCYQEEFTSFNDLNNKKEEVFVSAEIIDNTPILDINNSQNAPVLDVNVPQKKI